MKSLLWVALCCLYASARGAVHTRLCEAAWEGNENGIAELLKEVGGIDVNVQDADGWTALMWASKGGKVKSIERLLAAGAEPNLHDKGGWTALMVAAQQGHLEAMRVIIEAGADVIVKNNRGHTAMSIAMAHKNNQMIMLLNEAMARMQVGNNFSKNMHSCTEGEISKTLSSTNISKQIYQLRQVFDVRMQDMESEISAISAKLDGILGKLDAMATKAQQQQSVPQ